MSKNKRKAKWSKKSGKLTVKKKFSAAINKLHRLKCNQQRNAVSGASNEFINTRKTVGSIDPEMIHFSIRTR